MVTTVARSLAPTLKLDCDKHIFLYLDSLKEALQLKYSYIFKENAEQSLSNSCSTLGHLRPELQENHDLHGIICWKLIFLPMQS
jgi:hypothetical protein